MVAARPRGWLWLALAALTLRVLIPAGFMPAGGGAAWALTVCTGAGPVKLSLDPAPHAPARHLHECAFAGLAHAADAPRTVVAVVPPFSFARELASNATPRLGPAVVRLRPPPTGPPALG